MDIVQHIKKNHCRTIGIDGNSGSGKTTFAKKLALQLDAFVIPIDLFHKHERKTWNFQTDISDFHDIKKLKPVIDRLLAGERFTLNNLYNHTDGNFVRTFQFEPAKIIIIEGLCSMKLPLDFKIFLNVDPNIALIRGKERDIRERNLTEEQWAVKKYLFHDEYSKLIPALKKKADVVIDTTNSFTIL